MLIHVIGGTGHIGRFLVPQLVEAGHSVTVVTRGSTPSPAGDAWKQVGTIAGSADQAETLAAMKAAEPEVVIDIPGTVGPVYEDLQGIAEHLVAIGSLWMYGEPRVVPTPEEPQAPCLFEGYAQRYEDLQRMVRATAAGGLPVTAIMPPNICGPGKIPLDCLGGRDPEVHRAHAAGQEVILPDGPDALVGPCDAEDIARCVSLAVAHREQAAGQIFNVGSAFALTWPEFVAAYGDIHGVTIPVRRVSWQEYVDQTSPDIGYWWHFKAHMCPDIRKAQRLLGYQPCHTPRETLGRAVAWMREEGII